MHRARCWALGDLADGIAVHQVLRRRGGFDVRGDDLQRLSPPGHEHIDLLGRYQLGVTDLAAGRLDPYTTPPHPRPDPTPRRSAHDPAPLLLEPPPWASASPTPPGDRDHLPVPVAPAARYS